MLAATGYLIANPLPSIGGEASEHFLMGNLRFAHFVAGYVFAIGFAVRIYWGFVGNKYARELLYLPVWRGEWWRQFWAEVRFYLFLSKEAPQVPAHNPLAQTAMWFFNTLLGLFLIVTGFALYGEGLGLGSWADIGFGWVIPLMGDSQTVRMWHLPRHVADPRLHYYPHLHGRSSGHHGLAEQCQHDHQWLAYLQGLRIAV